MSKSASTWSAQAIERLERLIRGARREVDVKSKFKVGDIVTVVGGGRAEVQPLGCVNTFNKDLVRIKLIPAGGELVVLERMLEADNGEPRGWSWAEAQMNKMKNDEKIKENWTEAVDDERRRAGILEAYEFPRGTANSIGYLSGSPIGRSLAGMVPKGITTGRTQNHPTQTIFRLKRKDGAKGFTGCYFVKVAEDSTEILVKQVGLSTAKVEDWVTNISKDEWEAVYNVGDEIINFLQARGGNFRNKD